VGGLTVHGGQRTVDAMPITTESIATPDGPCSTAVVTPDGAGPHPAVILFCDAGGRRPSMLRTADRIAAAGYLVLVPDLFHRAPPIDELFGGPASFPAFRAMFADPERKPRFVRDYYLPALDYGNLERTIGAVLDHVADRPDATGPVGTTGYCMGGNASVRVATIFGERIAATAAFHPGGLVTEQPDSPHRRVHAIRARLHLAPARGDLPPAAETALRAELDAAAVRYHLEQVAAAHGYAVDDSDAHDAAAAARHDVALAELFAAALSGRAA
jgi:carboxymethylenebutenolidase